MLRLERRLVASPLFKQETVDSHPRFSYDSAATHQAMIISILELPATQMTQGTAKKIYSYPEFGALLLVVFNFLLVVPSGEYLVDDEWAFVKSLQYLYREGRIVLLDWNPMSIIAHLVWGRLFVALFGFSFTTAKISTAALLFVECAALSLLLRRLGVRLGLIWAAVLTLLFNPLSFFHSFVYETDVPACAWSICSIGCYCEAIRGPEKRLGRWLILGSLFASASFLVRQSAILIPLALFVYTLTCARSWINWIRLTQAFIVPVLTIACFSYWYYFIHGPTAVYLSSQKEIEENIGAPSLATWFFAVYCCCAYIGLFAAPLTLSLPLPGWNASGKRTMSRFAGLLCLCLLNFVLVWKRLGLSFPYLRNKLTAFGYLSPNELLVGNRPELWGERWSIFISILSLTSFCIFCCRAVRVFLQKEQKCERRFRVLRFLGLVLVLQTLYLLATWPIVFDRHFILLLPALVAVISLMFLNDEHLNAFRFTALIAVAAMYSICNTHDVYNMSAKAFAMGQALVEDGIDPSQIDAGYAFDGWHMYERSQEAGSDASFRTNCWWIDFLATGIRPEYVVSLSVDSPEQPVSTYRWFAAQLPLPDLSDYEVTLTDSFKVHWPGTTDSIFLMKKRQH